MKSLDKVNSVSIKGINILLSEATGQGKSLLRKPRGRLALGCGPSLGQWGGGLWCSCRGMAEGVHRQSCQEPKRRRRKEDSDKLVNLNSTEVEPMDIKRASVCRILAIAKVKVPSSNGVAQ